MIMGWVRSGGARLFVALVAAATAVALMPASTEASGLPRGIASRRPEHRVMNTTPTAQILGRFALPAGVPSHGRYAFLLQLSTASTLATYRVRRAAGATATTAATAAESQLAPIKRAQASVIAALPKGSRVLYSTHAASAGVAVMTDVGNYRSLFGISGVQAVYPIAPKSVSNSYAMALQHAPQAWQAHGDLGENSTIAIIDTGIDYTHADFGGPGTPAAYQTALANDTAAPTYPDPTKIVGGYDFVGDAYDASNPAHNTPAPDGNPLDCLGHGSHVAGIAAGYGENPDGSTFTGNYLSLPSDTASYQAAFRIGPGMAPKARLLAYKVFGCAGATSMIGAAIDRAADPNQDGDPSDHADVINMSLGASFGSPQDGDSVEANLASVLGITVVTAAGNDGDVYDVGGAPGDAVRTIDVADSVDAYSQIDTLHASVNSVAANDGAERSVQYDWANKPDLSGSVVALTDPNNLDGCSPLSPTDTARVAGKVAFLEWTDDTVASHCGSQARSDNVFAAGAIGAILGDDSESFLSGINGDAQIPVVLVVKSAADSIRNALDAIPPQSVTITGTSAGDRTQLLSANDDKVNESSSRGLRAAGSLKPDVSAVGTSVFSTDMGTGNQGVSFSGTSMASPMVAGLAALVKSLRKDWTPEEVKADIMNTAGQDLFAGDNHTGSAYAPNRVGAGRIQADTALRNLVVAYDATDPGAVSVSYGPVEITAATTLSKTVTVKNKSFAPAQFSVGYHAITSVPGVSFSVSPSSITLGPAASANLTVSLVVTNPAALTKTRDATVAPTLDFHVQGGSPLPREFLADASGRIELTPSGGYQGPGLRVPVYAAPRPASAMTQAAALALPGSGVQTVGMTLSGKGVKQGSGATAINSYAAGFELQATSGVAPNCAVPTDQGCIHIGDDRAADLKYVGFTSDAPLLTALNPNTSFSNTETDFAITAQRSWRTPVGTQEFDVLIDTNNDGTPDAVVYNTRLGPTDIFLSELVDITDPQNPFIRDDELINDRFGDTDSALFDSDAMVLPLWTDALYTGNGNAPLPGFDPAHTRIHYGVASFSESGLIDTAGVDPATGLLNASRMTVDLMHPAVEVTNPDMTNPAIPPINFAGALFNPDQNGRVVTIRRDVAAYNADHATGMLMVHFHNRVGAKANVVVLKTAPRIGLRLSAAGIALHQAEGATIAVANTAGHVPTGTVTLRYSNGVAIKSAALVNGAARLTWVPGARGTFSVYVTYSGDGNYGAGKSGLVAFRVI
jgi:subtilisin family serine protease